jgi:hypothetical protein
VLHGVPPAKSVRCRVYRMIRAEIAICLAVCSGSLLVPSQSAEQFPEMFVGIDALAARLGDAMDRANQQ